MDIVEQEKFSFMETTTFMKKILQKYFPMFFRQLHHSTLILISVVLKLKNREKEQVESLSGE